MMQTIFWNQLFHVGNVSNVSQFAHVDRTGYYVLANEKHGQLCSRLNNETEPILPRKYFD